MEIYIKFWDSCSYFSFAAVKISAQTPQIIKRIAVFVFEDKTDKSRSSLHQLFGKVSY